MLIVVSHPQTIPGEAEKINLLFEMGMDLFHLRKPEWKEDEASSLLRDVQTKYHDRIVFHQAHELARRSGSRRIHFKEAERNKAREIQTEGLILSTSIHALNDVEALSPDFNYAFAGPVFDSISKKDYRAVDLDEGVLKQKRKIKLIGIGGITHKNLSSVLQRGFDGVAVLGAVWQDDDPLKAYIRIRQNYEQCAATHLL